MNVVALPLTMPVLGSSKKIIEGSATIAIATDSFLLFPACHVSEELISTHLLLFQPSINPPSIHFKTTYLQSIPRQLDLHTQLGPSRLSYASLPQECS